MSSQFSDRGSRGLLELVVHNRFVLKLHEGGKDGASGFALSQRT